MNRTVDQLASAVPGLAVGASHEFGFNLAFARLAPLLALLASPYGDCKELSEHAGRRHQARRGFCLGSEQSSS